MPADFVIHNQPLSYESRLDARTLDSVDLVVIHCTELPDLATAREYGERIRYETTRTGNSGHYYIDTDGSVHRYVAPERIANHTYRYNAHTIG
ncbi:MAG TPA: N-acetylmuramoyl-L-alanine amidase, partial [Rudaea sp.]